MAPPNEKRKDEHLAAANSVRRSAYMLVHKKSLRDFVKDTDHDPKKRGISAEQLADFFVDHCGLIMPAPKDMGKLPDSKPFCLPTKLTTKVIRKNHKLAKEHNRKDRWSPNLYAVANLIIMKVTRLGEKPPRPPGDKQIITNCRGTSYAQQVNPEGLEPQFLIIHHWGEEFSEFMQSVLRHALYVAELDKQTKKDPRRWQDVTYWCSPFSENQHRIREVDWEDFKKDSPVHAVLQESCRDGVVITLNLMVSAFTRLWCIYEVLLADRAEKDIMICTQHGPLVQDQSQRSEEQAEWAAHMVAVLRKLDIRAATCAFEEDSKQIKQELEETLYDDKQGDEWMKQAGEDFKRILASQAIFTFALHGWSGAMQDALLLKVDPERCDRRGVRPLTYALGCRESAPSTSREKWDKVVEILQRDKLKDADAGVEVPVKPAEKGKEDAEAVVEMWDDNMRKRASALRKMRASEKKPSFDDHRDSFKKAEERHRSLCADEQAKRQKTQHLPPESGGNLCYAPTRHHLKRAHEVVNFLHGMKSVEEAKQELQKVCRVEINSTEANVARDYKLIGHLRLALQDQGANLPSGGLFWQGGCVYGRAKAGDPPWKIAERSGEELNILKFKDNLEKVCLQLKDPVAVDVAAVESALKEKSTQETGKTLMVVLSDMEPDDVMAIAQLWYLKHAELAGPPVLGMLLDFKDKDKNNIFVLKLLIASLVVGLPANLHVLPPAKGEAVPGHPSAELVADAIARRGEAISDICKAIREFKGTNVDLYVLGPGHGNIGEILKGLQANGAWPPAEGITWRVQMYTGEFNIGGMGDGDLDALKSIARSSRDKPLVDVGKFPLFGKEKGHPCTASFTTFALETFASKLNIQAPLLAGALKIFNDEFNAKLIYPEGKVFGKNWEKATEEQRAHYMENVKGLFKPEEPATIKDYAAALMESISWPIVQDKKKSTVVAFAKDSCDSPLCDQLVFLQEWLVTEKEEHPRALTNDVGHWAVGKFSSVVPIPKDGVPDAEAKPETLPVLAVQPAMEDPYDEELLDHMRKALQDFLLGHLEVLYP